MRQGILAFIGIISTLCWTNSICHTTAREMAILLDLKGIQFSQQHWWLFSWIMNTSQAAARV